MWWVDLSQMPGSQKKPGPGMEQLISAAAFEARTEVVGAVGKEAGRRGCGEHQKNHRMTESFRLEKPLGISESNHQPNSTKFSPTPHPPTAHPDGP